MLLILRGIKQSAVGHQIAWGLAKSPQNWFAKWSKSYQIAGSLGPYAVCPGSPDLGRFVQTSRRFVQPGRVPLRFVGFAHFATLHPPRLAKSPRGLAKSPEVRASPGQTAWVPAPFADDMRKLSVRKKIGTLWKSDSEIAKSELIFALLELIFALLGINFCTPKINFCTRMNTKIPWLLSWITNASREHVHCFRCEEWYDLTDIITRTSHGLRCDLSRSSGDCFCGAQRSYVLVYYMSVLVALYLRTVFDQNCSRFGLIIAKSYQKCTFDPPKMQRLRLRKCTHECRILIIAQCTFNRGRTYARTVLIAPGKWW